MIRVRRKALPEDLDAWLRERADNLRRALEAREEPPQAILDAYRHPPLKAHLKGETHGKCIYCESKITHLYFGDVEHIKPKSLFPAERLDIGNLGFVCAVCNNNKREFWNATFPVLNPYEEEPDAELLALGFLIARRPGNDRARLTIEMLDLNRPDLLERRRERIEHLQALADEYVRADDPDIKDLLRAELLRHAADDSEYAFIVRTYLEGACSLSHDAGA